ncbi:uncharacterized protein LOC135645838 [Musa acuminata AAA Group]|uniref:(wild Malaysian banana) hypothetical protein n=1 Tax=Musa acuminata subsp. malaccensis TaxID=214687 RepID=A0A804KCD6_MUSAM|nr:PREDICTED: uncharacterized protein LOC103995934 [Musa acuminata subsp. malaccensis]CAG1833156.1 unnamed protein product [Musa acuminata subsp. malaccensis]
MASSSFPPSAWGFAPTQLNSSSAKPAVLLFRTRPFSSFTPNRASSADQNSQEEGAPPDPVKLAFAKAKAYQKDKKSAPIAEPEPPPSPSAGIEGVGDDSPPEVPSAVKLAMERAKEYKKGKGAPGPQKMSLPYSRELLEEKSKKRELKVSSVDFLGLDFAEKKTYRGRPPGLNPVVEPISEGDLPEVELIVGDPSKFGESTPSVTVNPEENDDNMVFYKPKVSTWGVFPRPSNISKTFGGGRNIKPGEVLETAVGKAAKEKRTRELLAAYKSKMGLMIDAKTKAECEKALKEGDKLMDLGRLREALPFYEKIMKDVVFQSELHGQAALQWSICQDSLSRPNEARAMYEKLQSHPNVQVSKRARQFAFSFQAMEMMKASGSSILRKTGYETYFDAFVENNDDYSPTKEEQEESTLRQGLPYIMFLSSPVLFIIFLAARKSLGL